MCTLVILCFARRRPIRIEFLSDSIPLWQAAVVYCASVHLSSLGSLDIFLSPAPISMLLLFLVCQTNGKSFSTISFCRSQTPPHPHFTKNPLESNSDSVQIALEGNNTSIARNVSELLRKRTDTQFCRFIDGKRIFFHRLL